MNPTGPSTTTATGNLPMKRSHASADVSGSTKSAKTGSTTSKPTSKLMNALATLKSKDSSICQQVLDREVTSKPLKIQRDAGTTARRPNPDTARRERMEPHPWDSVSEEGPRALAETDSSDQTNGSSISSDEFEEELASEISSTNSQSSSCDTPPGSDSSQASSLNQPISRRNIPNDKSTSSTVQPEPVKVDLSEPSVRDVVLACGCNPSVPAEFGTMATTITMLRSSTTSKAICHSATCSTSLKATQCQCPLKEVLSAGSLQWCSLPATSTPTSGRGRPRGGKIGGFSLKKKRPNSTAGSTQSHVLKTRLDPLPLDLQGDPTRYKKIA